MSVIVAAGNCLTFTNRFWESKLPSIPAQQTSTAKMIAFFIRVLKTVNALRVNEAKLTSRNAFISNLFALEKGEKIKEGPKNSFLGLHAES